MMSFKNIDVSKIEISEPKPEKLQPEYKGNIQFTIKITDHVLERFCQRFLNNVQVNHAQIKQDVQQLIYDKGIQGFAKGNQSFVALPDYGLFIIRENVAVTFIGLNNINLFYLNMYADLLNKGEVK